MGTRRGTNQVASNQSEALEPHRDVIAALRASGASLQDVADRLAKLGIQVNRHAVDRFCKKHRIAGPDPKVSLPIDRRHGVALAPPPTSKEESTDADDPSPEPTAEPHTPPMPTSRHTAATNAASSPTAPSRLVEPKPMGAKTTKVPQPPAAVPTEPRSSNPPPAISGSQPAAPSPPNKAQIAIAKVLAELPEYLDAIMRPFERGDREAMIAAINDSIRWLQSLSPDLPQQYFEIARTKIAEQRDLLINMQDPAEIRKVDTHPLFNPMARAPMWEPETPLLVLNGGADQWTLRDAFEGTLILGSTGSGKTSGSGALLARGFLQCHFGGLVLTAKQDEASLWEKYANIAGRQRQMCFVRPGGPFRFNFLDYQSNLPADQGGSTENVVEVLYSILESFSRGGRGGGGGEYAGFWANTARQLLRNLVRVMRASRTPLSLGTFRRFMSEAPQSIEEAKADGWKSARVFGEVINECQRLMRTDARSTELDEALRYWLADFPNLNPKTRSIVVTDFTAMIDLFFDPALEELFLKDTTITPEAMLDGAVIVIDLPIEKYLAIGRLAQLVWKFFVQLAVKRRADADDASRRPVFLWIDEFQSLLSEGDSEFQATARSARCATVLLTQNMPGLYAQAGPRLPRERIDALAGNLATKIFHANSDPTTNTWAAEQIGKSMQYRASISSGDPVPLTRGLLGRLFNRPGPSKTSTSPVIDYQVQPSEFTQLRTGGERHQFFVEAFIVKSGGVFGSTGAPYARVLFQQETLA